jgi:hypothetical protein
MLILLESLNLWLYCFSSVGPYRCCLEVHFMSLFLCVQLVKVFLVSCELVMFHMEI